MALALLVAVGVALVIGWYVMGAALWMADRIGFTWTWIIFAALTWVGIGALAVLG